MTFDADRDIVNLRASLFSDGVGISVIIPECGVIVLEELLNEYLHEVVDHFSERTDNLNILKGKISEIVQIHQATGLEINTENYCER